MPDYVSDLKAMQGSNRPAKGSLHNHDNVREALRSAIEEQYPEKSKKSKEGPCCMSRPYVQEVSYRTTGGEVICEHEGKCYRKTFTIDKDGGVSLSKDMVEVERKTEYVPVDDKDEEDDEA